MFLQARCNHSFAFLAMVLFTLHTNAFAGELDKRTTIDRSLGRRGISTDWFWKADVLDVPVEVQLRLRGAASEPTLTGPTTVDYGPAVATFVIRELDADMAALDVVVKSTSDQPFTLQSLKVTAMPRVRDIHRQFIALSPFHNRTAYSSYIWDMNQVVTASVGVPFIQGYSRDGTNRWAMGFVDQTLDTRLRHDSAHTKSGDRINTTDFSMERPSAPWASITEHELHQTLFFSTAAKPRHEVTQDYVAFVDEVQQPVHAAVPEACLEPLWCSWYACRGSVNQEKVMANARVAKELGIGTILIDAGWFSVEESEDPAFPLGRRVYNAGRFPDFPKMVDELHAMGLKVVVWTAPIFWTGTRDAEQLAKWKAIKQDGSQDRYLCPRVEEVPQIVAAPVADIIQRYGLDGVKVDFMDIGPVQCFNKEHTHACDTLGQGMDRVFREIHDAVTEVNPDAIIEYRTQYANLNNRQYANCFRANDSPYDYDQIRREIAMIKYWSGPVAPHADYAYWPPDESLENKARFMASIVYGCVPTLSLDLAGLGEEDRRLITQWLAFYQKHREDLVFGRFVPLTQDAHYTASKIVGRSAVFFGLFGATSPGQLEVSPDSRRAIYLLNGTNSPEIHCEIRGPSGRYTLISRDANHRECGNPQERACDGTLRVSCRVPIGGLVEIVPR